VPNEQSMVRPSTLAEDRHLVAAVVALVLLPSSTVVVAAAAAAAAAAGAGAPKLGAVLPLPPNENAI